MNFSIVSKSQPTQLKKLVNINKHLFLPSFNPFRIFFMHGGKYSSGTAVRLPSNSFCLSSTLFSSLSKNLSSTTTFSGFASSLSKLIIFSGFIGIDINPLFSLNEYGILYKCLEEISIVSMLTKENGLNSLSFIISSYFNSVCFIKFSTLVDSNILFFRNGVIICCKYAAIFLGPSGNNVFVSYSFTFSGNASKGTPI